MAKRKSDEVESIDESNKAVLEAPEAPAAPVKPKWADSLIYLRSTSHAAAGWVLGADEAECRRLFGTLVKNMHKLEDAGQVELVVDTTIKGPVPGDMVLCSLTGDGQEPIARVPFQSVVRKPSN